MIDTKEVREVLATDLHKEEATRIALLLCDELDALRKPGEGLERPKGLSPYPIYANPLINDAVEYANALEAENARLREYKVMYQNLCK